MYRAFEEGESNEKVFYMERKRPLTYCIKGKLDSILYLAEVVAFYPIFTLYLSLVCVFFDVLYKKKVGFNPVFS